MQRAQQDRRIRVIHLVYHLSHYRAALMRRLSNHPGLDFVVCSGADRVAWDGSKVASVEDVDGVEGINWRPLRSKRLRFPLRNYEWQPGAVVIALREDFDVLISFGHKSLSNWLVRVICRFRRIPLLEWTQGLKGPETGVKWALKKFLMSWASAFLLYGRFAADFFVAHGFRRNQVFVIHNSLDHDRQQLIREHLEPGRILEMRRRLRADRADARLVFFSGRFTEGKNLPLLLDGLAEMRSRGRRVVAALIGEGPAESALRRQAERLELSDQVVFYGPCYDEETLALVISSADLCVVPRSAGLIVMHSLVYGTPILTCENSAWTHGPETEAVIEGVTGSFFRDGDVTDLADKMEALLYPISCRGRMAAACMQVVDTEWTPEYMESVVLRAINSVLPRKRRLRAEEAPPDSAERAIPVLPGEPAR